MDPPSLESPLVRCYIFYSSILAMKLLAMAALAIVTRMWKGVFMNCEDVKMFGGAVKYGDSTVERFRRAHLNDLENIVPFWLIGALYLTTSPGPWSAWLFRVFAASRVLHTFVYCIIPLPQPSRAIAFGVPYAVMFYMGAQVAVYYIKAL